MIVVNSSDVEAIVNKEGDPMIAKGPVYRKTIRDANASEGPGVLLVTFAPGAKLGFHTHSVEQILYVTEGKGVIATRDKEYVVTPGMAVFIPAGEDHMHGATEDSSFTHLALYKGETKVT